MLIFFVRLVSSTFHQLSVSCVSTASTGPRILQDVLRETFVRAFARQFQPHLGHPYLVVLVLHSIQCPDHIPAESRSLVCSDMVCNSAWGCGCNHHHDSCNSHRVFVHPHNLEQYVPPHPSITFSPRHAWSYGRSYLLHKVVWMSRLSYNTWRRGLFNLYVPLSLRFVIT